MLPPGIRPAVRKVSQSARKFYFFPIDLYSTLRGREDLVPPPSLIFVGDGDFKKTGEEFARHFIDLGGLKPDHTVLDVGCGVGRMAVPLTHYLSERGRYVGFDIVREGVDWARKNISRRFPNFTFLLADIYNKGYNPSGKTLGREYRFPVEDGTIDFVYATSVLTHLLREEMERYIAETSRVLKPGGHAFLTYFLTNDESMELMRQGKSALDFHFTVGDDRTLTIDTLVPENAIAFNESDIRALYARHGMKVLEPIRYGSWSGRSSYLSYQDIVIAEKM